MAEGLDPMEVIGRDQFHFVLNYLNLRERVKVERVSKPWQMASLGSWWMVHSFRVYEFVKEAEHEDCMDRVPEEALEAVWLRCSPHVRHLELGIGLSNETAFNLFWLMLQTPPERLVSYDLDLECCVATAHLFLKVIQRCRPENIRRLTLRLNFLENDDKWDAAPFVTLFKSCTSLRKLHGIIPDPVVPLDALPQNLRQLHWTFPIELDPEQPVRLPSWPSLRRLLLRFTHVSDSIPKLSLAPLAICNRLHALEIKGKTDISDLCAIASLRLRKLRIPMNGRNDASEEFHMLTEQARTAPIGESLVSLSLDNNMDNHAFRPIPVFRNLETLGLKKSNVDENNIDYITRYYTRLRSLKLSGCGEVDDECLGRIGLNCPKLKELNLGSCEQITNAGLGNMFQAGLSGLKTLKLRSTKIDDKGLKLIGEGAKQLETLDIAFCWNVTDESNFWGVENLVDARFPLNNAPFLRIYANYTFITKDREFHEKIRVNNPTGP